MEPLSPSGTGRPSPIRSFVTGAAHDPSSAHDAEPEIRAEEGPLDGSRLIACLQDWAPRAGDGRRLHYRIRCSAADLPDAAQLAERLQASSALPGAWRDALVQGWPPPLRGLHRIDLVPGAVWVSIAIGLQSGLQRRLDAPSGAGTGDRAAKRAVVVGAGLAGCAMADALARRGWRVTILERSARPGGAVTEIPLLAQHPALSPGDDRRSRLLVAALLVSRRLAGRIGAAMTWCGRFQPMPLAEARKRTAGVPASIAQPVEASQAAIHGIAGRQGIWYPVCAMADLQRWWQQLLQDPGIDLQLSCSVAAVSCSGGRWQAVGADGAVIASAAVMILATQAQALTLAAMPALAAGRLRHSRIQVAIGSAPDGASECAPGSPAAGTGQAQARRPPILGGSSYRLEEPGRHCVIGPLRPGEDDLLHNRISLPGLTINDPAYHWRLSEPAERLLLRDNLPMVGEVPDAAAILADPLPYQRNDRVPLPRRRSLHLLTGLGGRGLLWSVLGAEMIAASVNNEPPIVEPDLQDAVDPARFLKRSLRRAPLFCRAAS